MSSIRAHRRPALLCLGTLALAALAIFPAAGCTVSVEHQSGGSGTSGGGDDLGPSARAEAVREMAREELRTDRVAGFTIGIRHGDAEPFFEGFGYADLENDVLATEETVYRIGSITKQFTAALVMQLVEGGEVGLQDDFTEYVDYPTGGRTITVERLLNHTSGIPSYTSQGERFRASLRLDLSHDELLDLVREVDFDFEPGEEYRYNNTGYYLLGMLIESVTGQSYADVLHERIAEPLGLEDTTYCDERRIIEDRAEGYDLVEGVLLNDEPLGMSQPFSAGALCSTVVDLLDWQRALESGEVVSEDSYRAMTTPGRLNDDSELDYGFGLGIGELEGHRGIRHGGGINGFVTMLARFPDDDLGIVVLTNTPGPTAGELTEKIARLYLDLPDRQPDEQ